MGALRTLAGNTRASHEPDEDLCCAELQDQPNALSAEEVARELSLDQLGDQVCALTAFSYVIVPRGWLLASQQEAPLRLLFSQDV